MDKNIWHEMVVTSESVKRLGNCCIWDVETDSIMVKYKGGSNSRCLSLIGEDYLLSCNEQSSILNVCRLSKAGKIESQINCPDKVTALAVSPDGIHCVGAIASNLFVWKVITGKLLCVLTKHNNDVDCIKFTDNGKYFVSGSKDRCVIAWSISNITTVNNKDDNGGVIKKKFMHLWCDHIAEITDIYVGHFGHDATVATVSRDKNCHVYNLNSGDCLFSVYTNHILRSVVMDVSESYLFLGTNSGSIIQVNKSTWSSVKEVYIGRDNEGVHSGHTDAVTCLSMSVSKSLLLSASQDATVMIWDILSWTAIHVLDHDGPVTNAFFAFCPRSVLEDVEEPPRAVVKPFQFSVSKFEDEIWEVKLKPCYLSQSTMNEKDDILQMLKESSIANNEKKVEMKLIDNHRVNEQLFTFSADAVLYTMFNM